MSTEIAPQRHGHLWRRTGLTEQDARDVFDRARRRASWAELAGWLRGRPSSRNRLPVLGEVPIATGAGGAVPGVQRLEFELVGRPGQASQVMVPIDQIVGTAELRSVLDRRFRPTSEMPRARFEWLAAAVLSGRGTEPVELYHCGGRYYVIDGNHRIAVARALGEGVSLRERHRGPSEQARQAQIGQFCVGPRDHETPLVSGTTDVLAVRVAEDRRFELLRVAPNTLSNTVAWRSPASANCANTI